jgi:hypothetical protein
MVKHGRTLFILEQKYGNDGYAFWFKLLELLGDTENHFYDCSTPASFVFLQAKVNQQDEEKALDILNILSDLKAIDPELWKSRIIWSDNFVNNIKLTYVNRRRDIPPKPVTTCRYPVKGGLTTCRNPVSPRVERDNYSQESLNEMKLNEMKDIERFEIFWKAWPRKVAKPAAMKAFKKIKEKNLDRLIKAIDKQKKSKQWQTTEYIPHPATWLNNERWNDETETASEYHPDYGAKPFQEET